MVFGVLQEFGDIALACRRNVDEGKTKARYITSDATRAEVRQIWDLTWPCLLAADFAAVVITP
jgi:hypothetical protein